MIPSMVAALVALSVLGSLSLADGAGIVRGTVADADGPVPGATVRVQATRNETRTGPDGEFVLSGISEQDGIAISAWKQGYYCSLLRLSAIPADSVTIGIHRHQDNDNPGYEWIAPYGEGSCSTCHSGVTALWARGAHSQSAKNPRFLSMYNGTDLKGNRSHLTRRIRSRDYGSIPLRPDPSLPYYGPGFKLDFPDIAGNCAACHVPGAALDSPYGTDPNEATGADEYGIHCDYCHKVAGVRLDERTCRPLPNRPGVLSTDVRRPFLDGSHGSQLFFGNLDDPNAESGDTCLPLLSQSQFCAPCHSGKFWDVSIYDSFGEWLASPYSDPATGRTCQQCHMPSPSILEGNPLTNLAPGKGGLEREPSSIHAHIDRGAMDEEFLRDAISLVGSARGDGDRVEVAVRVKNEKAGHHYPTDSPLRHLLLVVEATDEAGAALEQMAGPRLPRWAGVGDPKQGRLAGLAGRAYAKILEETWTGVSPTGAYWNMVRLVSDNRLAALASDTTSYLFRRPASGVARITATLLFRRAYMELMEQKGWDVPDIMLARQTLRVPGESQQ